MEYLVPSTLGIGLVKAYDTVGLENSLTKPHLRRLVSAVPSRSSSSPLMISRPADGRASRPSVRWHAQQERRDQPNPRRIPGGVLPHETTDASLRRCELAVYGPLLSCSAETAPRRPFGNTLKVKLGSRTAEVAAAEEEGEAEVAEQHKVTTRTMTTAVRSHRAVVPAAVVEEQPVAGMRVAEVVRRQLELQDRQEARRRADEVGEVQPLLARVRKWTRRMTMTTKTVSFELT